MVTIDNGILKVGIHEKGAELASVIKDGKEYIWCADPAIWAGSAYILFPICGGLKEDKYLLGGKEYFQQKHGFARHKTFKVEENTGTRAVFLLTDDEDTLKGFPFKFELRAIFELQGDRLITTYKVKNLNDNTMYFSIGSHEAYATPEGIEQYDVIFDKNETLETVQLAGNLLGDTTIPVLCDGKVLPLYDKYFFFDALVFRGVKSRKATLKNRITGREVMIEYPDNDYVLLWHKHGAPYICFEPWSGINDTVGSSYNIEEKEGIIPLDGGKEYTNVHTITFVK